MPELYFRVRWPDDSTTLCYSPSSTIRDAFELQQHYGIDDFVARSRSALEYASARVARKYGYGCGHALRQIAEIETLAKQFAGDSDARVAIEAFEEQP